MPVHVRVPQEDFDQVYSLQLDKLLSQVKLPGFRPGKTPRHVIKQRFSGKLHEDTVSELVQNHYTTAIEKSALAPAIQPELVMPDEQPESGFEFILKVVTWPEVKLEKIGKLSLKQTSVKVNEKDVQDMIERVIETKVRYESDDLRQAEMGDQLRIDFIGFLNDEPFEGGKGEDAELVLGQGQFIPDFEQGLTGAKSGDDRTLSVQFPEAYHHKPLAGMKARFEVQVKSVARPIKAENEKELASMLGFDDAAAMRADIQSRLEREAEQAAFESDRNGAFDALIAAHKLQLPEALILQDMQASIKRMVKSAHDQGQEPDPGIFRDEKFQDEVRRRSERSLKLSLLVGAIREKHDLEVSDKEENEEIDRMAGEYPEDQKDQFKGWVRGQKEQISALRDRLLEKKSVDFIFSQAKVKQVSIGLGEWQAKQNEARESV